MQKKRGLGGVILVLTILAAGPLAAQDRFSARLGIMPIDFRTQATTTGGGSATGQLADGRLQIAGNFSGLAGPATMAELHLGAATGARGPAIATVTVDRATNGQISGSVRLNREQQAALRQGRLYVQIYSDAAPEGNLWGWLIAEDSR
jgi:hypothetical protein